MRSKVTNPARPPANVLIVDDEQQIRRLISVILGRFATRYTVRVTEADTADAALAALARERYHLIISDYSMPGKSGIDLLASAFAASPTTARMLITALGQLDIGVEAINRGHVDAFLRKPWDNQAFLALVDSLLEPRVAAAAPRPLAPEASAFASGAGAHASAPAPAGAGVDRVKVAAELQELERTLKQMRVRLGLGSISPEGYRRVTEELNAKRAKLELLLIG